MTEQTQSIEDILHPEQDGHDEGTEPGYWKIRDREHADYAILKRESLIRQRLANLDLYQKQMDRLNNWLAEVNEPLEEKIRFRDEQLGEYMRRERDADPSLKSIKLPAGTIQSRITGAGTIVVNDEDAFVAFCEQNGKEEEWLRVSKRIDRTAVKAGVSATVPEADELPETIAAYDENGECIPGISVSTGTMSVQVKVNEQ